MSQVKLTGERFVRVLDAAGIDEKSRARLHQEYEKIDPEGHAAFLAALNFSPDEAQRIRAKSKTS